MTTALMAATAIAALLAIALPTTTTQAADTGGTMPAFTSTFGADNAMAPNIKAASTSIIKTVLVADPTTKFSMLQTTSQNNGHTQLGTKIYTWTPTPTGMELTVTTNAPVIIKAPDKVKAFGTTTAMKKAIGGETGGEIAQQNKAVFGVNSVDFQSMLPAVTMRDMIKAAAYLDQAKQPAPYFDLSVSRGVRLS